MNATVETKDVARLELEVSAFQARIEELESRQNDIPARLKEIPAERKPLLVARQCGDAEATAALRQLDDEERELRRELHDLELALEAAQVDLEAAQEELARAVEAAARDDVRRELDTLERSSELIAGAYATAKDAFLKAARDRVKHEGRKAELFAALNRTGVKPSSAAFSETTRVRASIRDDVLKALGFMPY